MEGMLSHNTMVMILPQHHIGTRRSLSVNCTSTKLTGQDGATLESCPHFAGAALVKYGSLLLDAPFHPSLPLVLSIIVAPCIGFAIYLGSKSR